MLRWYRTESWWKDRGEDCFEDGCINHMVRCPPEYAEFVISDSLEVGDYGGAGSCGRSNLRVWHERFGSLEGEAWTELRGDYGYRCIAVRASIVRRGEEHELPRCSLARDIYDALCALEDYPLLDEEDHSALQLEEEHADWESYGCDDYAYAVGERFRERRVRAFDNASETARNGILTALWYMLCERGPGDDAREDGPGEGTWFDCESNLRRYRKGDLREAMRRWKESRAQLAAAAE